MDESLSVLKNKSHLRCLDPTSSHSLSARYAIQHIQHVKCAALYSAKKCWFLFDFVLVWLQKVEM